MPKPGVPESFKVLVKELQSLCLDICVLDAQGNEIELKEDEDEGYQPDQFRGDDDYFGGYAGNESDFAAAGFTMKETSDDDDLAAADDYDDASDEDDLISGDDE